MLFYDVFNMLGVVMNSFYIDVMSKKILNEILKYRRRFNSSSMTIEEEESNVLNVQLPRIKSFLTQYKPIIFILPAFPTKSPNSPKVLGETPDMAEKLSLTFLNSLCERIKCCYPTGAEIIICSDGHVFGELICVCDDKISHYQFKLGELLRDLKLNYISVFNLNHVESFITSKGSYSHYRKLLIEKYSLSRENIKKQLIENEEGLSLYRAITPFFMKTVYCRITLALKAHCKRVPVSVQLVLFNIAGRGGIYLQSNSPQQFVYQFILS